MLDKNKYIHFIGAGGAGMSALEYILLEQGYMVSGSDIKQSAITQRLSDKGVKIFIGHKPENVLNAAVVVVSTAIAADNPELLTAITNGISIWHRSQMLAELMKSQQGIAVAGSHGKTTTTAMLAWVLEQSGEDPSIAVGSDMVNLGCNGKWGQGKWFVAEADESDGSFLRLPAKLAVITNIENDHLDHYGTLDKIVAAFEQFISALPAYGAAALYWQDERIRSIASKASCRCLWYGLTSDARLYATDIRTESGWLKYDCYDRDLLLGTVTLQLPGKHNVLNSLAVIALTMHMGLNFNMVSKALAGFTGVKRRFETKMRKNGIWIVDDYAHHPTEIANTLSAARQVADKRVICIFQPHRYTRTKHLMHEFATAFSDADMVILTDIYSAGEIPILGVSGKTLFELTCKYHKKVKYIDDWRDIADYLQLNLESSDLIITMGAGNIVAAGEMLKNKLLVNSLRGE